MPAADALLRMADFQDWVASDGCDAWCDLALETTRRAAELDRARGGLMTDAQRIWWPDRDATPASFRSELEALSTLAECYYVSADMGEVAAGAAVNMPAELSVLQHDPPSPAGILLFDRALRDRRLFDPEGPLDIGLAWVIRGNHVLIYNFEEVNGRLWPSLRARMQLGRPFRIRTEAISTTADVAHEYLAVALWRLMQQRLTSVTEEEAPRQIRRQLERRNRPTRRVTVVTLRHAPTPPGEERDVQWSHRWLVRGHWRKQPYKDPDTGETFHRYIYIHGYVKGPEGAPLLIRDKVYALVR